MTRKSATSIAGIYTITNNVSGTVYIGQAVNIRRRWESHRHYLAAKGHRNSYLQRAWDKYGADAFEFAVYAPLPGASKAELDAAEIAAFQSFPDLYNLMEAGLSAPIAGPETRAIWSEQRLKMWADPEFRRKRSEGTKALYQNAEWKAARDAAVKEGLSTPEMKEKASKRFKAIWSDDAHRAVQSEKRKANWQDPEYKARQALSRSAGWADPEVKKRRIAAVQDGKRRAKEARLATSTANASEPSSPSVSRNPPC